AAQFLDRRLADAIFDNQHARARLTRPERRREVLRMPGRRVDRLLQVHAGVDVTQKELRDPLVLLVATGRTPGEIGFAVAQRHRRRQRRARAFSRRERGRMLRIEPELLRARAETEAELWDRRRGLQPAARWRRRHHIAGLIDDVEMHGVAAHRAGRIELRVLDMDDARVVLVVMRPELADGRLARAGDLLRAARDAHRKLLAETLDRPRPLFERGLLADELLALGVVRVGEQRFERHLDKFRVAIELIAVGVSKLRAFDQRVDEIRAGGVDLAEIELLHQCKLLEHRRALAPDATFADGVVAVFECRRRFDRWLPARHVIAGEHAAVALATGIHNVPRPAELVDRLGNKPLRPGFARALDLLLAAGAGAFGLAQDAVIGIGERAVGEHGAGLRHYAAG